MTPRKGSRVRRGSRFGTCHAVYSVTAVVQWEGDRERDVAWLHELEVVDNGSHQMEHQQKQRPMVAHSTAQSPQALDSRTRRNV